ILEGFEVVTIDPLRGFTAFADAGPKDVMPIVKYLRRFTVRGVTINLVHHDTKPPSNGPDARRRSHRASGGAWFSASECPVSFEKISDGQALVSPEDYKFSSDPQPFTITYTELPDGCLRLLGEDSTAKEAAVLSIDTAVTDYLREHIAASGTAIAQGIHKRKDDTLASLDRLFKLDKVDWVKGPRKAKLWSLRSVVPSGSGSQ